MSGECCGNGRRQTADAGAYHDDVQLDGGFWLHLHTAIHGHFVAGRRRRHCPAGASEENGLGDALPRALDLCKHGRVGLLLGREIVRIGRVEMPHCERSVDVFLGLGQVDGKVPRYSGLGAGQGLSFGFTEV